MLWAMDQRAVLASNGNKPRVQVRWPDQAECISTFDKATQSVVNVNYGFEGPDDLRPDDTKDEVQDSRRHQFFASCRHRHRQEIFPRWISRADFERAKAFGFPIVDPGPRGILDSNPDWSQCVRRIQPDHARLPITQAQAQAGFIWDIQDIPTGTYIIDAYTWEPPENLWTHPSRPGAIRIWDSRKESGPPPAAAIRAKASIGYIGQPQKIRGCIAAGPGATVSWSVSPLPPLGVAPTWVDQGPATAASNGAIEWTFTPPAPPNPSLGVSKWMVRLHVQEPDGRSYDAYSRADLLVLNPSVDAEFVYEPPPKPDPGCSFTRPTPSSWCWLALLLLAPARRRSRTQK